VGFGLGILHGLRPRNPLWTQVKESSVGPHPTFKEWWSQNSIEDSRLHELDSNAYTL